MAAAEVIPPTDRPVLTDDAHVALVTAWADRQRAMLADLRAELASVRASAAGPPAVDGAGQRPHPTTLLPLVDDLLQRASERLAARTAEVVAAADHHVAAAAAEAARALTDAGRPASAVRPRDPLAGLPLSHRAARTGAELWRSVSGSVAHPIPWDPPSWGPPGQGGR